MFTAEVLGSEWFWRGWNPKISGNGDGSLNLPNSGSSSSSFSGSAVSNKNYDNNDGSIFAKLFNFLAFGRSKLFDFLSFGSSASEPEPNTTIASSSVSAEESKKALEYAEKSLMCWG